MPAEIRPSTDFFTEVNALSGFQKPHPSKIQNQRSPIINPLFHHCRTVLPTEEELIAELERERRVIEEKQEGGDT